MRVVIAPDLVGPLSALDAATSIAAGWSGERVEVVPLGEAGSGFVQAVGDLVGGDRYSIEDHQVVDSASVLVVGARAQPVDEQAPIPEAASSTALGRVLRTALERTPYPGSWVLLDLTGQDVHDGGAGLVAALGATADVDLTAGAAGLAGIGRLDLDGPRRLLAGHDLTGVTDDAEAARLLLGLRGITSIRGRASGADPARMLAVDEALQRVAALAGVPDRPGVGANGGLGLAVTALGGALTTGAGVAAGLAGLPGRLRGADLAVTGCTRYDFAARGGGVVAEVARLAAAALVPCIVLAGEVMIGGREMRTMGIEAAYPLHEAGPGRAYVPPSAATLTDLATRVARSWHW